MTIREFPTRMITGLALAGLLISLPTASGAESRASLEERVRALERKLEQYESGAKPAPAAAKPPETGTIDSTAVEAIVDDKLKKQKVLAGWQDGFLLQSPNGDFKLKLRGYVQADGRV